MMHNYSVQRTGHSTPIKKGRSPGRLHSRWQNHIVERRGHGLIKRRRRVTTELI